MRSGLLLGNVSDSRFGKMAKIFRKELDLPGFLGKAVQTTAVYNQEKTKTVFQMQCMHHKLLLRK